jgi:hypothetical protein
MKLLQIYLCESIDIGLGDDTDNVTHNILGGCNFRLKEAADVPDKK